MLQSQGSTYIIAEAGVNHNGSLDMARKLIDVAAEAGADAVKFQTFKADKCISRLAAKAEYQTSTTSVSESQLEMVRKLELDEGAHRVLIDHCKKVGIQFLSTPFDLESVDLLAQSFNLPTIKIPAGEITNAPLLLKISQTGKTVILSTGMSTLGEVEQALGVLAFGFTRTLGSPSLYAFQEAYRSEAGQEALGFKVKLLHCTTEYPAPFENVNLRAMDTLKAAFGLPVGYSDHTRGIAVSLAAVARGAVIIEKHFTLDRGLPGPDHQASLEPDELTQLVTSIRDVEISLGNGLKLPARSELKNIDIARKSLVAGRSIEKGEMFHEDNIAIKRPGGGISPMQYWRFIGEIAQKSYLEDELIIP